MRYAQQDKMLDRARHELASIHAESAADRMNDEHRDADYQTVAMLASEREQERDYADAAPLWRRAANLATQRENVIWASRRCDFCNKAKFKWQRQAA